jgi:hypothetical protein
VDFTLDNTNDVFSYQPVTYSATATTGTTTIVNGFTVLSNGGYALEVEGRAAILRPGDSTNAPSSEFRRPSAIPSPADSASNI